LPAAAADVRARGDDRFEPGTGTRASAGRRWAGVDRPAHARRARGRVRSAGAQPPCHRPAHDGVRSGDGRERCPLDLAGRRRPPPATASGRESSMACPSGSPASSAPHARLAHAVLLGCAAGNDQTERRASLEL